ncbi:autotransporter-associated N-terminal domain-containing protein [Leptotrichia wadei]|nr:autotransporter-associated N-terminal domain-containing protein [Leptotrichia wadei]
MSNNLRQIARDLRSFVKRCKDVHYSDSLLISFLITGLLTIAPKLHADVADVASEQQEVTAQTYDAITDLRQSFMRARKENEKSLKGAQSELVQLLRQGDQVIKSPWSSFQFGTGYMNNDWGTTYRGRGGKFLEYYKRDNDLTKYVFDPTKHLYGATNLNIPRNKEPNSLTINPANIHEPYKPYVPERLDNINGPTAPSFRPDIKISNPVSTRVETYNFSESRNPTVVSAQGASKTSWGNFGVVTNTTGAPLEPDYTFSSTNYKSYNGWDGNTASDGYERNHINAPNETATITNIGGSGWGAMASMWNGRDFSTSTDLNNVRNTNWSWWYNPTTSWSSSVQYENLNGTSTSSITPGANNTLPYYTPGNYWNSNPYVDNQNVGYDYIYARSVSTWTYPGWWNWSNESATKTNAYNYYIDPAHQGESIYGTGNSYTSYYNAATLSGTRYVISGVTGNYATKADAAAAAVSQLIDAQHNSYWTARYNAWNNFGSSYSGTGAYRETLIYAPSNMNVNYTNAYIGNNHPGGSFMFVGPLSGGSGAVAANMEATRVHLYNGTSTKNNAAYVISTSGGTDRTLKLSNGSYIYGDGSGNNIGFNIQARDWNPTSSAVNIFSNADMSFYGNNNSVYKVNSHLGKLNISNGDAAPTAATFGHDNVAWDNGAFNTGVVRVNGNNNIVYDGLAPVEDSGGSKLYLSDVQVGGDNNIMVALQQQGYFGGEIKLQGAMGGGVMPATRNNVAVYANTAQGSVPYSAYAINSTGQPAGDMSKAVDIKVLNVGMGANTSNSTLVYADNATQVNVLAGDANNNNIISDGAEWRLPDGVTTTNALNRGYDVKRGAVSTNGVIGYATGGFTGIGKNTAVDTTASSTINFKAPVDMVSLNGVAYYTQDGGIITQIKDTRAAGYKSIIALADGVAQGKNRFSASTVKIKGNITAADNIMYVDQNAYNGAGTLVANGYQNIGGAAINGGYVLIEGATTNGGSTIETGTGANAASPGKSLIYGMGAYAKGTGSTVIYANGDNNTTTAAVSVVSGDRGALWAEDNGAIEFNGEITHQNNVGLGKVINTKNGTTDEPRFGRGIITNDSVGDRTNDHDSISPFYVKRNLNANTLGSNSNDTAHITFNKDTTIYMYDGILLNGNIYGSTYNNDKGYAISDYHKDVTSASDQWKAAKYRGMSKVTTEIKSDNVVIGVVNQAKDEIVWTSTKAGGTGVPGTPSTNFLSGIGAYAGNMVIKNTDNHKIDTTLINGSLKIDNDVNIEDIQETKPTGVTDPKNDTFNHIKMESEIVTNNKKVSGDAANRALTGADNKTNYQVRNVGFALANSLSRWDNPNNQNPTWIKTSKDQSKFVNLKEVDIWGGRKEGTEAKPVITGLLVNFGTIQNGDGTNKGYIRVDHGNAIVGTDGSVLQNMKGSEITVTGQYKKPTSNAPTRGTNGNRGDDTDYAGENYGIVGISDTYEVRYNYSDLINHSGTDNSVKIEHEDAKIFVEGDQATGIYAENRGNAAKDNIIINYKNGTAGTNGIDVRNSNVTNADARGIGIALVNNVKDYVSKLNAGGTINLTGASDGAFTFGNKATNTGLGSLTLQMGKNDILTGKNGIGIYAEAAKINLSSDKFTVETQDNGVGLWGVDDTNVAEGANHQKTFQYNYSGASNKNGFAMAFTGKKSGVTNASNDLDIKFTNVKDTNVNLAYELTESKAATPTANRGTYKGIVGILVNTNDGADTVTNRGNIEEDSSSKTNVRAYGAVVNKGTFVNFGKIKLNDSLDAQASTLTSEDMKKVNVGIFANSTNKLDTTITNRGDITIGDSTNNKNIGSWAIYGYNVNTDSKEDGTKSKITINRNNYGIYSGDGNVNIKNTKLLVGNDTVLGHVQTTSGVSTAPGAYPINRQTAYANANDLLSGLDKPRELDSAIGVYIDKGSVARNINVSADMDIDRFSYGIVMAEKNGGPATNVTIGDGAYTLDASGKVNSLTATDAPTVVLASNRTAGGQVKSTAPSNPKVPEETKEQGNAVYYYSADTASRGKSWANVTMNGDYNTAYYTKGSMDNFGTIDLRSKYDVDNNNTARGYGNVGIFSANTSAPSTNYGTITTGMSDTVNMEYSAAMAAGRNHYKTDGNFDKTTEEGYIVNRGNIIVKEKEGIGMFATGAGSKAVNYGNIRLEGESAIGMYLDRGAIGENYGEIEGNAQSLKGVVAINGGYIKNYGHINVTGSGSYGIVTDGSRFIVDANGNPTEVLKSTDSRYTSSSAVTAGQTNGNGGTDLYGGKESSIEEGTSGNPKTTGVGTTITAPDIVPITKVSVDGIDTPIFDVESDAANPGDWAKNITVSSSIQTGGTRIIDLSVKNEWGNPVWEHAYKDPLSEVTSIGMYVDTSGVRYTNPIDGIQNLPKLGKVDLYFGPEATLYTNSKAIRIGDKVDVNGNVTKSNILKPFNDALSRLPGGAKVNVLSASLTWQVLAKLDSNNQLSEIYMSKVPYHSFAYDNDKSLVNFTNNLDNIYEIARQESAEKVIFNKLNSLGNGEGHILAQAFDQMRGHIYGGVQQRIKSTSDILGGEISSLRSERNVSKDSNKFKAFGQRNEFKTDTAGMPDWYSNAGGFAFVHEDETVRLGQSSGWSAGVVNNYFTFKDLSKSYENQAMAKVGVFKSIPLDANGTFILSLGGDGFFGRNDMKRRFWVVDQQFRAKASYYSYGAGLNAGLEKSFVVNDGFSIVPNLGIRAEYGRFSSIHEKGDMALNVKSDDYVSVKPSVGIDFRYNQEVFKNSNLTASLGFAYENEIGKLYDVENEARIVGAWTDYFGIRGDKEDKRGNFKSDLKLGLDNGRFGFNVNTGYDSKGHNFRAGMGLKVLY